jgi:hypothetical protein
MEPIRLISVCGSEPEIVALYKSRDDEPIISHKRSSHHPSTQDAQANSNESEREADRNCRDDIGLKRFILVGFPVCDLLLGELWRRG